MRQCDQSREEEKDLEGLGIKKEDGRKKDCNQRYIFLF